MLFLLLLWMMSSSATSKLVSLPHIHIHTYTYVYLIMCILSFHNHIYYSTPGNSRRTGNKAIQISISDNWMEKFSQGCRLFFRKCIDFDQL
jgi:hypothetical protein